MMLRQTSSPMRSASASGPSGWLMPSFITVSMASFVATPSMSVKQASLIIGMRMRFETKPGESFTSTGVLPRRVVTSATTP